MSATFIPALVIKHNNDVYLTPDLVVGVTMSIPTPGSGGVIDGDFWAVPINNYGIVSGFNFEPTTPNSTDAPSDQSFHVFRLISRFGNDVWYVRGSSTSNDDASSPTNFGYIEASQDAECCSETPRALPTDIPDLAPCQEMCEWDADQSYFAVFQLPALTGTTPNFYAYGSFNGVPLTALSSTGYASPGALVTALNTNWSSVGTWAYTNGVLKVTQTDGPGTDVLCVNIIAINPSA